MMMVVLNSQDVQLNGGIGLFDGLELTFDLPYSFTDNNVNNEDGVNDFTLRPEWMFIRETDTFPAMSLAGVIKFDSGDSDVGSGTTDYGVFFNLSKTFEQWGLHTNIGYNFIDNGVKIEPGNIATNFESRTIQQDLILIGRYLELSEYHIYRGNIVNTRAYTVGVHFHTPKRATPSITATHVNHVSFNYLAVHQ